MKRSYIWAGVFALAMAGWLASGQIAKTSGDEPPETGTAETEKAEKPFRVAVRVFASELRQNTITLRGRTEPHKSLDVLVRTPGIVEKSHFREGDRVKTGDVLCELDLSDRGAKLAQARANQASARRDYEAALKLEKKKFVSEAKLASELARLNAADAAVEQMELDIGWTKVKAPVDGTLSERPAEQGRYLKVSDACARITVLNPIVARGQVAERDVGSIGVGQPARVSLVTGEQLAGTVRFIAPQADIATRTFKVEVEAPNADRRIRAGITAAIDIPVAAMRAHLLPSALVSLDDTGVTGIYAIGTGNRVEFLPVKLLNLTRDGAWVSGLPDRVTLITVGQHYVLPGQTVEPVSETETSAGTGS